MHVRNLPTPFKIQTHATIFKQTKGTWVLFQKGFKSGGSEKTREFGLFKNVLALLFSTGHNLWHPRTVAPFPPHCSFSPREQ